MSFYRMTVREAESGTDLRQLVEIDGVPVYVHADLYPYFDTHPLVLTTRGLRLAIGKDDALIKLEQELLARMDAGDSDRQL